MDWHQISVVTLIIGMLGTTVIRMPRTIIGRNIKVEKDRKSAADLVLVFVVSAAMMVLPLLVLFSETFAFANYEPQVELIPFGVLAMAVYLWLFYRSHGDLGKNWSISLEIREGHHIVKDGVYRHIRHPMYTALFLHGLAQILLLPNWLIGPSAFVSFAVLFAIRVDAEEQMLLEKFGDDYRRYMDGTKRLIPGVW